MVSGNTSSSTCNNCNLCLFTFWVLIYFPSHTCSLINYAISVYTTVVNPFEEHFWGEHNILECISLYIVRTTSPVPSKTTWKQLPFSLDANLRLRSQPKRKSNCSSIFAHTFAIISRILNVTSRRHTQSLRTRRLYTVSLRTTEWRGGDESVKRSSQSEVLHEL